METDFPRGRPAPPKDEDKKKRSKSQDKKELKKRTSDFLFGSNEKKKVRSSSSKEPTAKKHKSLLPLGGGAVVQPPKGEPYIEALGFGKLTKGMRLLSCVKDVFDDLAVVALPNLWTGYMTSDAKLSQGQYLSVVVVKAVSEQTKSGPRRRVQVTAMPSAVNPRSLSPGSVARGQVVSVEDHGLLIDLGLGRKGFLKFDDIEGEYTVDEEDVQAGMHQLTPGRLIDVVVGKSASAVLTLTLPNLKRRFLTGAPALGDLLPGSLVHATVDSVVRNGLCVSFLSGVFRGAVEIGDLGGAWIPTSRTESTEWRQVFERCRSLDARIIAVDDASKIVRMSLEPHLLALMPPPAMPSVGTVVESATVIRVDAGLGALLALPERLAEGAEVLQAARRQKLNADLWKDESYVEAARVQTAYVHISKAADGSKTSEANFGKDFAPSTTHKMRILSTSHAISAKVSAATAPSIVAAHVLTHGDLKAGDLYRAVPVVAHVKKGAVLVEFGMGIRGMIPEMHLFDSSATSDFRTRMFKQLYAIGNKVDVRILTVDPESKRCTVTAKKSLVRAQDLITDFRTVRVGQKATGFVSKVADNGLSVSFFNSVYGRVTARSLAVELGMDNIAENYSVGDVVQCRVINVKWRKKKGDADMEIDGEDIAAKYCELTLSLRIHGEDGMEIDENETARNSAKDSKKLHICPGAILPLRSLRIVELVPGREKEHGFVPGYAIVSVKSKYVLPEDESKLAPQFIECKLPYDQLLDDYDADDVESASALDALAAKLLTVGKKIDRKGLVLTDPGKITSEFLSGVGKLTVLSIRSKLIAAAEKEKTDGLNEPILPSNDTDLYVGARVVGYVAQVDSRHGAFVRFLGGRTGLVPKVKGGLAMPLFSTVVTNVATMDVTSKPAKIMLKPGNDKTLKRQQASMVGIELGHIVKKVEIVSIDCESAELRVLDKELASRDDVSFRIHCTLFESKPLRQFNMMQESDADVDRLASTYPFSGLKIGTTLSNLHVAGTHRRDGATCVEMTNRRDLADEQESKHSMLSEKHIKIGQRVSAIVSAIDKKKGGLWIKVSPVLSGFIPCLELSDDVDILNQVERYIPPGARLECTVIDKDSFLNRKAETGHSLKKGVPYFSVLQSNTERALVKRPSAGDRLVGRILRHVPPPHPPSLAIQLRGGSLARCCICELDEPDNWVNMPMGQTSASSNSRSAKTLDHAAAEESVAGSDSDDDDEEGASDELYGDGRFVNCRVLSSNKSSAIVDVSLRSSRLEGDLDEDNAPEEGDIVHAYVVNTNKKGCFVRLSRLIEGRVMLKELSDGYLSNPEASFPMGRLVVGKAKAVKNANGKVAVDLDLRESVLVTDNKLTFEDIVVGHKYKGTVTRLEDYGVFVRISNSDVSGLVHKSECSDNYIKKLSILYDPGDLVKILVVKKDKEKETLGFSMKASHFEDDEESDESEIESVGSESDEIMEDLEAAQDKDEEDLNSDDENFASKLAAKMAAEADAGNDSSASGSDGEDSSDSESESSSDEESGGEAEAMDTNVGFDWGGPATTKKTRPTSDDEAEEENASEDEDEQKSSHKSRRKHAEKQRQEEEISRRETALADGTADENPETSGDFERLLASSPDSSELWIKYMAFHLSLADIPAARDVAERAFERISFRQEGERLNVWCALLTLELKYGSEKGLQETIDRACQHNNPKYVYLRVCEMLEKETADSTSSLQRADEMYAKMCKKFRDKKTVWMAYIEYLLKTGRQDEAQATSKRALQSLPSHKHVETMSKFAQLVFEYGSPERARTIFDGLLMRYPKKLDLFFVFVDKEVKHGHIGTARSLFERQVAPNAANKMKLKDKQMKKFFKKWYAFEELHGNDQTQDRVKEAARAYVEQSS